MKIIDETAALIESLRTQLTASQARASVAVRLLNDLCDARELAMLDGETEENADDARLWLKVHKHLRAWERG